MQSSKTTIAATCLAAAFALVVSGARFSSHPRPSKRYTSIPESRYSVLADDLAHEYLDFESARQALIRWLDGYDNAAYDSAALKGQLGLLSSEIHRDGRSLSLGCVSTLNVGTRTIRSWRWMIDLDGKRWTCREVSGMGPATTHFGDFSRDRQGKWIARPIGTRTRTVDRPYSPPPMQSSGAAPAIPFTAAFIGALSMAADTPARPATNPAAPGQTVVGTQLYAPSTFFAGSRPASIIGHTDGAGRATTRRSSPLGSGPPGEATTIGNDIRLVVTGIEAIDWGSYTDYWALAEMKTGPFAGVAVRTETALWRLSVDDHGAAFTTDVPTDSSSLRFTPLPPTPPAWLDLSSAPPRVADTVPTKTLAAALESRQTDWETRFIAARALGERAATDDAARLALVKALSDPRREVRQQARTKLDGGVEASLIPILVEQLKLHAQFSTVVSVLQKSGPDVVPEMIKLIEPPFAQPVASSAASVLCFYPEESRPHLALLLKAAAAGNDWALQAAFTADTTVTLGELTQRLSSDDPAIRRRAAACIFLAGPPETAALAKDAALRAAVTKTVAALVARIKAEDPSTLRPAARALPWFLDLSRPAIPVLKAIDLQKHKELSQTEIDDIIRRIEAAPTAK